MHKRRAGGTAEGPRLRVAFLLARRFTLTAFASFVDVLRLAADEGDGSRQLRCGWAVMSATRAPVAASCGVEILPTCGLLDPREFDYVVVVGGLLQDGRQVDDATVDYLRRAAQAGVPLIGVCTGSFVLAQAGLMTGREACVSWFHRRQFLEAFCDVTPVSDRLFLIDGDRITCSGGAGVADLAAALIEQRLGPETARKTLRVMQIDGARPAAAPQSMPSLAPHAPRDDAVRRAVLLMEQNMSRPPTTAQLAARIGLSARQLERRFLDDLGDTPAGVFRAMRLDYGRWLIETVGRTVGEAAQSAGFADGAHFARLFRKRWGIAPAAVRARGDVGNILDK